jgi:molecular chaperone DnaK (HSP70)
VLVCDVGGGTADFSLIAVTGELPADLAGSIWPHGGDLRGRQARPR